MAIYTFNNEGASGSATGTAVAAPAAGASRSWYLVNESDAAIKVTYTYTHRASGDTTDTVLFQMLLLFAKGKRVDGHTSAVSDVVRPGCALTPAFAVPSGATRISVAFAVSNTPHGTSAQANEVLQIIQKDA